MQSFERLNHPLADGVPGNGKGKAHGRNLNTGFVGNVANWAHDTIVVMVDFTNANFGCECGDVVVLLLGGRVS